MVIIYDNTLTQIIRYIKRKTKDYEYMVRS